MASNQVPLLGRSLTSLNRKDYFMGYTRYHGNSIILCRFSSLYVLPAVFRILAVSYEARKFGVGRRMTANEAKRKCPSLQMCYVPERNGKADLTRYRKASAEVLKV